MRQGTMLTLEVSQVEGFEMASILLQSAQYYDFLLTICRMQRNSACAAQSERVGVNKKHASNRQEI